MSIRWRLLLLLTVTAFGAMLCPNKANSCCTAPRGGQLVVNADQTVIIIWDAAKKVQHFIRKASFRGEAEDFGFIIPSPSQPELNESGDDAFPYLLKLTEPEVRHVKGSQGMGCGCSDSKKSEVKTTTAKSEVVVLQEKQVAGFDAVVLEATSASALTDWLKDHGYANSPEIQAWAKPYVDQKWKFTALKVAKDTADKSQKKVTAAALRMSFKTDRPLFPYREPDYKGAVAALGAPARLLRVYFLAEARFAGELTKTNPWTGKVAWSNKLTAASRTKLLDLLKLPETTGPENWWLTEFEDAWPYRTAPADVYFARGGDQSPIKRPPIIQYDYAWLPTDGSVYLLAVVLAAFPLMKLTRRRKV
jgi:hypothetical protein